MTVIITGVTGRMEGNTRAYEESLKKSFNTFFSSTAFSIHVFLVSAMKFEVQKARRMVQYCLHCVLVTNTHVHYRGFCHKLLSELSQSSGSSGTAFKY